MDILVKKEPEGVACFSTEAFISGGKPLNECTSGSFVTKVRATKMPGTGYWDRSWVGYLIQLVDAETCTVQNDMVSPFLVCEDYRSNWVELGSSEEEAKAVMDTLLDDATRERNSHPIRQPRRLRASAGSLR
jgi:hypothetical protein